MVQSTSPANPGKERRSWCACRYGRLEGPHGASQASNCNPGRGGVAGGVLPARRRRAAQPARGRRSPRPRLAAPRRSGPLSIPQTQVQLPPPQPVNPLARSEPSGRSRAARARSRLPRQGPAPARRRLRPPPEHAAAAAAPRRRPPRSRRWRSARAFRRSVSPEENARSWPTRSTARKREIDDALQQAPRRGR